MFRHPQSLIHYQRRYRNIVTASWSRCTGFLKKLCTPRSHIRRARAGVVWRLITTIGSRGTISLIASTVDCPFDQARSMFNKTKSTRRLLANSRTSNAEAAGTASQFNSSTSLHTKVRLFLKFSATITTRDFSRCPRDFMAPINNA